MQTNTVIMGDCLAVLRWMELENVVIVGPTLWHRRSGDPGVGGPDCVRQGVAWIAWPLKEKRKSPVYDIVGQL